MKTVWTVSGLLVVSLALGGCSSSRLLNAVGLGNSPSPTAVAAAPEIQVGNSLVLPPDLRLPPPGTGPENYQPTPAPAQTASVEPEPYTPAPVTAAPVKPVKKDIYAEYGISKTKPDGTPKLEGDLKAELKAAMLKRKRQTQPGFGTIFNMGNIFSDG